MSHTPPVKAPFLALLLALPQIAGAQIDSEPENRDPMTAMPGRFGLLYGTASSESTGSDFNWQQLTLQGGFALRKKVSDELMLFSGLNYGLTTIDQGRSPLGSKLDTLHEINLPISGVYHREGSPWTFFGQVAGQLATDFNSVTSDDLYYSGRLGAQYDFSDSFSLNFGVARVLNFGEAQVLPAIGFIWEPRDDWSFTLIGPRITLSHRINERFIIRGGGFPMGGLWNVEDDSGDSVDYGFGSYNAGLGLDYKLRHGVWLSVWGGANFASELRAERNGDTIFEDKLDSGLFGYIGINLYEW